MSENTQDSVDSNASNAPIPLTPKQRAVKQKKFLEAYRKVGIVKYACAEAHINRSTYKYWRDHDPEFVAQLPDAIEDAHDTLELAAYSQAVLGIEEYVVNMGQVVFYQGKPLTTRKYAPSLLQTLLKANMPEKYKDKQALEHSGKIDGSYQVHVFLPE